MSQPNALPGPDNITRRVLPNGITVLVRENHTSPSIVINAMLRVGSVFETRAVAGLAQLTASALMRGTATRSFNDIYEPIESIGASLGIYSAGHGTFAHAKSLAEDLPLMLELLADVLRAPSFPEDQLAQLRAQITTELQYRAQDTRQQAALHFYELAYPPEHPYHFSQRGYPDTVPELTRERVQDFHQKYYGPRGMVVAIVGAVRAPAAVAQVEAALGGWENPAQPGLPALPDIPPLAQAVRRNVYIPDKSQADIVLGAAGPSRAAPDWWPAYLANNILGVFGMYGRLGDIVREKQGLAYYSYSTISGGEGRGSWRVIAGVNPKNVERALDSIVGEIARMTAEFVSEAELEDVKSNITGLLPLRLESNEGVAGSLLSIERYQLGLDYLRRYAEIVRAVTREEVLAAARHYLDPQAYAAAVAGPVEAP
ncbi:MAG: insulinase family protein [Anaerolineae bacterium]|nr:insulinase family protein [Anaerolineae bacterium]